MMHKHQLDLKQCIMIGDSTSDKTFADRLGIKFFNPNKFNNDKYKATNSLNKITQKKWGTKLCLCMVEEYFNGKIKNYGTHDN